MINVKKLTLKDPDFPEVLRNIPSPPKQLYILGDLSPLMARCRMAVVGSRHVSPYGRQVTTTLVEEAARQGVVIVSGLALGVDGIAHTAALRAGGTTMAVLPCGLGKIYPSSNAQLAKTIIEKGGALISEYPPQTPAYKQHFIARNRLVSGISDGILITEAARQSGTSHTARFALEQGRTVMAVPGNITSQFSEGTNNFIKQGALPVTETTDILFALGVSSDGNMQQSLVGSTKEQTIILELLVSGISNGSELLRKSALDTSIFNQSLTMLELDGRIRPLGADHWGLR